VLKKQTKKTKHKNKNKEGQPLFLFIKIEIYKNKINGSEQLTFINGIVKV
jgi:hypothetical protein